MEKYKFLEHTADAKYQAYGKTLEEAFSNAAIAMFSIFSEPEKVKAKIKKTIEVRGKDKKALLYNFLEEFLFLLDSEGFLLHEINKIKITGDKIKAEVVGEKINESHKLHGEVKAVTYNNMIIDEEKNMVQVVVDL